MTELRLSTGISRGRETPKYPIVRLRDGDTNKLYRCMGGGYDMRGTVLGEWLQNVHQDRLRAIGHRAYGQYDGQMWRYASTSRDTSILYGMNFDQTTGKVRLDGACGESSMVAIARACGLAVQQVNDLSPKRLGLIGWDVTVPV